MTDPATEIDLCWAIACSDNALLDIELEAIFESLRTWHGIAKSDILHHISSDDECTPADELISGWVLRCKDDRESALRTLKSLVYVARSDEELHPKETEFLEHLRIAGGISTEEFNEQALHACKAKTALESLNA